MDIPDVPDEEGVNVRKSRSVREHSHWHQYKLNNIYPTFFFIQENNFLFW
jgi:hypothetical protein